MNDQSNLNIDIDSLLDGTLDDLADLPEFKPFPAGATRAIISWDTSKKINGVPAIQCNLKGIETVELANESDTPIQAGDETSVLFQMDSEFGQGKFKNLIAALKPVFGGNTNRETIEASQNGEVVVVTTIRKDKKDPDRKYTEIVNVVAL